MNNRKRAVNKEKAYARKLKERNEIIEQVTRYNVDCFLRAMLKAHDEFVGKIERLNSIWDEVNNQFQMKTKEWSS